MKFFRKKEAAKPSSIHALREIYTSEDGSKWFEFENPMNTPAKRAIAAEVATRYLQSSGRSSADIFPKNGRTKRKTF